MTEQDKLDTAFKNLQLRLIDEVIGFCNAYGITDVTNCDFMVNIKNKRSSLIFTNKGKVMRYNFTD